MIRDRIKSLRRVKASELIPNPRNWRVHPPSQQAALREVIDQIGYADALIARETPDGLVLIDGHLRAETTPDTKVPVLILDIDEDEADVLLATLDPLAAMAQADQDALAGLLDGLDVGGEGTAAMLEAMADGSYEALTPKPVQVVTPEVDEKNTADALDQTEADDYVPFTERGQVWQLGEHRLMCGDGPEDHGELLDGVEVDVVLTDPPYGIGIVKGLSSIGGGKPFGRVRQRGGRTAGVLKGKVGGPGVVEPRLYAPVAGDDVPFDPRWLLDVGQNQIIFGGTYFADKLPTHTSWVCWDKSVAPMSTFSAFELAWTSYPGRFRIYRHTWSGMVRQGTRHEELKDRVHPTQKPVGLFGDILDTFTSESDAVFDPYLGSGTTIIAAEKLNRRCYAMEIDPRYCDVAIRRWEAFTGRKAELVKTNSLTRTRAMNVHFSEVP